MSEDASIDAHGPSSPLEASDTHLSPSPNGVNSNQDASIDIQGPSSPLEANDTHLSPSPSVGDNSSSLKSPPQEMVHSHPNPLPTSMDNSSEDVSANRKSPSNPHRAEGT